MRKCCLFIVLAFLGVVSLTPAFAMKIGDRVFVEKQPGVGSFAIVLSLSDEWAEVRYEANSGTARVPSNSVKLASSLKKASAPGPTWQDAFEAQTKELERINALKRIP